MHSQISNIMFKIHLSTSNILKSRKKHQDKVQDAKRQEKAQKVKKKSIPSQHNVSHRATMGAACWPRKQKNKSEENLCIAARWSTSQHDDITWRPS
jgi:hypothetical protein